MFVRRANPAGYANQNSGPWVGTPTSAPCCRSPLGAGVVVLDIGLGAAPARVSLGYAEPGVGSPLHW